MTNMLFHVVGVPFRFDGSDRIYVRDSGILVEVTTMLRCNAPLIEYAIINHIPCLFKKARADAFFLRFVSCGEFIASCEEKS